MLTRNSDIVRINYDTVVVAGGNQGSTGVSRIEALLFGHHYRIRQSGTISRISVYIASLTNVTQFNIRIWRKIGTTYFKVGETGNLLSLLSAPATNTIDLPTPIENVREGDRVAWLLVGSVPVNNILRTRIAQANAGSYFYSGDDANPVAFENQTYVDQYIVPIELYAQAPHMVSIGDSLISGSLDHCSYADTSVATTKDNELNRPSSTITAHLNRLLEEDLFYQNMGVGGQNCQTIAARYVTDVVNAKPRYSLVQMGINDILGANTKAAFLARWTDVLNADVAAGIASICTGMVPNNLFTDQQYIDRADWNNALQTLIETSYPTARYVDLDQWIGVYRPAGPDGNLEARDPLYLSGDHLHLSAAGNYRVAQAIYQAFVSFNMPLQTIEFPAEYEVIEL